MCACLFGCLPNSAADDLPEDACIVCKDELHGPYVSHSSSQDLTNFTCLIHESCQEAYNKVERPDYVVEVDDDNNVVGPREKLKRCANCLAGLNNQFIISYPTKEVAKIQMVVDKLFLESALANNLTAVRALLGGPVSLPLKQGVLRDGKLANLWRVVQSDGLGTTFKQKLRRKVQDYTTRPTREKMDDLTAFIVQSQQRAEESHDSLDDLRFDALMLICAGDKTSPDLLNKILEGHKWGEGAINWAIFHLARLGKKDALQALLVQEGKKVTIGGARLALDYAEENCIELLKSLHPDPDSKD